MAGDERREVLAHALTGVADLAVLRGHRKEPSDLLVGRLVQVWQDQTEVCFGPAERCRLRNPVYCYIDSEGHIAPRDPRENVSYARGIRIDLARLDVSHESERHGTID